MDLPRHHTRFSPNLAHVTTREGRSSVVKLKNYYTCDLFPALSGRDLDAVADVAFYDENGRKVLRHRERLAPRACLFMDVADLLGAGEIFGTVSARVVPVELPSPLEDKTVSTEYLVEIREPRQGGSFVHAVAAPSRWPVRRRSSRVNLLRRTGSIRTEGLILINSYHGPPVPVVSQGYARIRIWNHRNEERTVFSDPVPRRGCLLFDLSRTVGDIDDFLDGRYGHFQVENVNLAPKGYIWSVCPNSNRLVSLEHY